MIKLFLIYIILSFSFSSYSNEIVFFSAKNLKSISYKVKGNGSYFTKNTILKTSDIFSVILDTSFNLISGPSLVVESTTQDIEPNSILNDDNTGKLLYSKIEFMPYNIPSYPPQPAKIYTMDFTLNDSSIVTSESKLFSNMDSYLSKEVSLYSFYNPCPSPNTDEIVSVGVKLISNSYQLWNFSINGNSISREIKSFSSPILSIDWKNYDSAKSILVFDDSSGNSYGAFYDSQEVKMISYALTDETTISHIRLSKDSKKIAFIRNQRELVVADFDPVKLEITPNTDKLITTSPIKDFDISPDGKMLLVSIYYQSSFKLGLYKIEDKKLSIINTQGFQPESVNWQ